MMRKTLSLIGCLFFTVFHITVGLDPSVFGAATLVILAMPDQHPGR